MISTSAKQLRIELGRAVRTALTFRNSSNHFELKQARTYGDVFRSLQPTVTKFYHRGGSPLPSTAWHFPPFVGFRLTLKYQADIVSNL